MLTELFDKLRMINDFGLVILIWLVQLIIYPSFRYCEISVRRNWHNTYTGLITVFVVPLMFGQVAIIGFQIVSDFSYSHLVSAILVAVCWVITFGFSVPQHSRIAGAQSSESSNRAVRMLVLSNWPRTILWTGVFILGILDGNLMPS